MRPAWRWFTYDGQHARKREAQGSHHREDLSDLPSAKYDELVCTAGVTESGDFVRLYPINFRDLPFSQQYKKYQWIEVMAEKHRGRDVRRESYRPDSDTIQIIGEPIKSNPGNWGERARYALAKKVCSMEELKDQQEADRTSLGIFKPKKVHDLVISPDDPDWKESFKAALQQARLWERRTVSKEPPRKVPFKFHYRELLAKLFGQTDFSSC